jgi:hypothetical protein
MGVFLKSELSMVAKTGNNQAQFPEVLLIASELECCPWREPYFSPQNLHSRPPTLPK